jgi:hypothetical protein
MQDERIVIRADPFPFWIFDSVIDESSLMKINKPALLIPE